jgi:predicted transcriptional regulator
MKTTGMLTGRELEIRKIVWEHTPVTVRDVYERLLGRERRRQINMFLRNMIFTLP